MQISSDDAFRIMDKWREESAVVTATLRIGKSFSVVRGIVITKPPFVEVICIQDNRKTAQVRFDLSGAETIEYGDWRIAPDEEQILAKKPIDSVIFTRPASNVFFSIHANAKGDT